MSLESLHIPSLVTYCPRITRICTTSPDMPQLQVALDWTPNTNHTGFYVARKKGFYQSSDLQITFLSPHTDDYKATPGSRCRSGQCAFAVTPSESVISSHTQQGAGGAPPLQARNLFRSHTADRASQASFPSTYGSVNMDFDALWLAISIGLCSHCLGF